MPYYWNLPYFQYYAAHGIAHGLEFAITNPFDTAITRFLAMPYGENGMKPMYKGVLDCLKITVKHEGYLALFKGVTPRIVCDILYNQFFVYGTSVGTFLLQRYYCDHLGEHYTFMQHLFIGAIGGVFKTFITAPTQRVKFLLQVQTCKKTENTLPNIIYYAPLNIIKKLYNEGGILNIYHGTLITLIRDVSAGAIYRAVCEYLITKYDPESRSRIYIPYAATVVAYCAYRIMVYPAHLIKTRIQTAPKEIGIQSVAKEILKHDGPAGFFHGVIPQLILTVSYRFAVFIVYYSIMPSSSWVRP